jgi:predicted N-acyltransferase
LLVDDHPFVRHAFLAALEDSGSLRRELGWEPLPLRLRQGGHTIAAAPAYLKTNSHGEFVFDWAWAQAYHRHGLSYYPKLLVAVPYTPATGPRLLVGTGRDAHARRHTLRRAIEQLASRMELSSAHLNFLCASDAAALAHDPWLPRFDWQYHFVNPGYPDFDSLLADFTHKKRKNIRAERRQAREHGLEIEWRDGPGLSEAELDAVHALYVDTFVRKGNTAALTRAFFSLVRERMGEQFHVAVARNGQRIVAAAVFFSGGGTLYGRYYGSQHEYRGLHFELCYYQGLEYTLRRRLRRFEPGAQGEHKIARGFLPTRTRSAHWIAHPAFRRAIRHALCVEGQALEEFRRRLEGASPFRQKSPEI